MDLFSISSILYSDAVSTLITQKMRLTFFSKPSLLFEQPPPPIVHPLLALGKMNVGGGHEILLDFSLKECAWYSDVPNNRPVPATIFSKFSGRD